MKGLFSKDLSPTYPSELASRALKNFTATGRTTLRFTARCQDPTKLSRSKPTKRKSLIGPLLPKSSSSTAGTLEPEADEHKTELIAEHIYPLPSSIHSSPT
jgi:hypothetical protein